MKPLRIYFDTSVIGGRFDEEFAEVTEALFTAVKAGRVIPVISDLVMLELVDAPERVRKFLDELEVLGAEVVGLTVEADKLALAYIKARVITEKYREDASHIAIATLAEVNVLVSWNFKHIVNLRCIHGFNGVNLIRGYATLEIRSPKEVLENGDED